MQKVFFVIDMDAFFASCEELKDPELKKIPIIVGHNLNGKGVVSTSNYKARKFGVKSGMPLFKAKALCPKAKIIEPDFEFYINKSNEIFQLITQILKIVEINSVDECYVEVTEFIKKGENPLELASYVQNKIFAQTGLTTSIGIGSSKELAKIASNLKKPFGIESIFKFEIAQKLWPLPIISIPHLGRMTTQKLNEFNIMKIQDLVNLQQDYEKFEKLKKIIGINLQYYISIAKGEGTTEINTSDFHDLKSISNEETFPFNYQHYEQFQLKAFEIVKKTVNRMIYRGLKCKSVSITFNKQTKKYQNSQTSFETHTNSLEEIWSKVLLILEKTNLDREWGFFGVRLSLLKSDKFFDFKQLTIDDLIEIDKKDIYVDDFELKQDSKKIINNLNLQFGYEVVVDGETFMKNKKWVERKKKMLNDKIKFKTW